MRQRLECDYLPEVPCLSFYSVDHLQRYCIEITHKGKLTEEAKIQPILRASFILPFLRPLRFPQGCGYFPGIHQAGPW